MRSFQCPTCAQPVFFENLSCLACGTQLGFDPASLDIIAVATADGGGRGVACANRALIHCNWIVGGDGGPLCPSCVMTPTVGGGSVPVASEAFERAKKRLIYDLTRFGLPIADASPPLMFLLDESLPTGHSGGIVTLNVGELDAIERQRQKSALQEPYRTLLGHLRHEVGHYYWALLVGDGPMLATFREVFGDETINYADALARHYAEGPPADWSSRFVSAYASAHPWEDWAETWAHYLHMVASLDSAEAEGIETRARGLKLGAAWPFQPADTYRTETCEALIQRWIPLTIALNNLTRSMGHDDFYPFALPAAAHRKLAVVHDVIRQAART